MRRGSCSQFLRTRRFRWFGRTSSTARITCWRWTGSRAPTSPRCCAIAAGRGSRRRACLPISSQAAEALTHLHSQTPPVIHGDVKPANLILTTGGRVKLVDFGISSAPNALRRRIGTPGFRAPELASDGAPSRASDVYALAATAFALLTGAAPIGRSAAVGGHRPGSGPAARGRDPPGDGDGPGAATGHAGRADRAAARRLGGGAALGRDHVLPVGHRGVERACGTASRPRWRRRWCGTTS